MNKNKILSRLDKENLFLFSLLFTHSYCYFFNFKKQMEEAFGNYFKDTHWMIICNWKKKLIEFLRNFSSCTLSHIPMVVPVNVHKYKSSVDFLRVFMCTPHTNWRSNFPACDIQVLFFSICIRLFGCFICVNFKSMVIHLH